MPVSFDTSKEELVKSLISTYENKLHDMLTVDVEAISKLMIIKNQNCRYLHISVNAVDYSADRTITDVVIDLKYNVPIIEAKLSLFESVLTYMYEASTKIKSEERFQLIRAFDDDNYLYLIECAYLKENELYRTVFINDCYNPDMVKTYKRYIELRGE